jgi:hypothetical protein
MKNDIIYYIIDQDEPSACWTMLQHLFETKNIAFEDNFLAKQMTCCARKKEC